MKRTYFLMVVLSALVVSCSLTNADKASTTDDSTAVAMGDTVQVDDSVEVMKPVIRYAVEKWKDGERLVAKVDGKPVNTGVGMDEFPHHIILMDQHDYNNDGYTDALVWDHAGGKRVSDPFFVTYNPRTARFEIKNDETNGNGFEEVRWDPKGIAEQQPNGEWHLLLKVGDMRTDTYLIRPTFTVKKIKESTTAKNKKLITFSREQLFELEEECEGKTFSFDIDDNGDNEDIVFYHDSSHASDWGKMMILTTIDENSEYCIIGRNFSFLTSKTNGRHDLLIDNSTLYKFNGKMYVQVE